MIIEQSGGSDKEKLLEAEIEKMRKERDREVEQRVEAILREGKLNNMNAKCSKCESYLDRISVLEAELKKINFIVVTLNDDKSRLNDELLRATQDISMLEGKKTDLEINFKRMRDNFESEITKVRSFRNKEQ